MQANQHKAIQHHNRLPQSLRKATTFVRCCILESGCWMLNSTISMLDASFWSLNAGCCILVSRCWMLHSEVSMLDSSFLSLDDGCCILDAESMKTFSGDILRTLDWVHYHSSEHFCSVCLYLPRACPLSRPQEAI